MTPAEIKAELCVADYLTQATLDWFARQAVPPMALARPLPLGTDTVVFYGARFELSRYEPRGGACKALVLPGFNEYGDLSDLVAWSPRSGALGSWLNTTGLLGAEQVFAPRFGPLVVHPTPLEWLRAERDGLVVIDPVRAGILLRQIGHLTVRSGSERRRLERAVAVRPPVINVEAEGRARA